MPGEVTEAQIEQTLYPERSTDKKFFTLAEKRLEIRPLKRRWQVLFSQAALPLVRVEAGATEEIQKLIEDGRADFNSISGLLLDSEVAIDKGLDRCVAIIMASTIVGAEKDTETTITSQLEWILDNVIDGGKILQKIVEAQIEMEGLVERVGERWPTRLVRLAHLVGDLSQTEESVRQRLTSFLQKLQGQNGAGTSTPPNPGGTSSDSPNATE